MTFWKTFFKEVFIPVFNILWYFFIWSYSQTIRSGKFITQWASNDPSTEDRKFKVYIYQDELKNIKEWVMAKDDIETGGDLFGLWIDRHAVVIQFVLGPGENCRRTQTSFFQDIEYLSSVGNYLTTKQGLCNVGQWHSHHIMNLPEPSAGDRNTVWNNIRGSDMERYVVFIATIKKSIMTEFQESESVQVNCFLFEIDSETKKQLPVLHGEICVMEEDSPMHTDCSELNDLIESGKEIEKSLINTDV